MVNFGLATRCSPVNLHGVNTLVVTDVFEKFRRNVEEKGIVEANSETRREFNEKV
jgi:hypothetical protein